VHERLESTIPVSNERVYKPALDVGYFATLGVTFQYNRPSGPVLGLPGVTGEMNRNGYRYQLYNSDNSRHTPARQPMYQSWPVLFHKGTDGATWLGVFHDNPSRTFVDLGELHPDQVRFESVAGNSRVYIVAGDSLEEASSKLIQLLGLPPRLPLFSFGYHQCRWSFFNSGEVHETVERFQKRGVPLDAIYLDIDYMDRYRVFTTSLRDFPDLPQMSSALRKHGIATVGILDPGVKVDPGYEAYSELTAIDGALKNKQGEPLVGEAWAGASLFPDFSSTRVRDWWREKVMRWLGQNSLDGAWNDMNEPTNWRGKNDATSEALSEAGPVFEQYNLYGARMAEATHAGLLGAQPDARPFNITRSGYPGVQQHAVIWHGDNSAWWEHLQLAIDTSVSYSLAGAFYTGADVPGFGQNAPVDLAVRFFQLGAFLPFFRGHRHILSKPNEPFDFGEEAETLIQAAIHQRYSLMREWVTGFELSIREGRAPIMPVFSPEGALVKDQFMLFDTFLVAPVLQRDQSARLVMLPEGTWYRLGKPEEPIDGGRFIIEPVSLASVPVFVRAGRVITRNSVGSTVAQTLALPERHEVYPLPGAQASGSWYDDDGVSLHAVPGRLYRLVAQNGEVVRQKVEMESPEA
jgi:alpha-glucosidase